MIVTIDGPAGAGKSTAARELAARLGFRFLDTGAMYRAATWACLHRNIDLHNAEAVAAAAREVDVHFEGSRVFADGVDVTEAIRTVQVTQETRYVAGNNAVRERMVELQRDFATGQNIVSEGRDQGTVVFPDAGCKFFLTADPHERALRRQRELAAQGQQLSLEEILIQQQHRDRRDESREFGALKAADDAEHVDTSRLDARTMVDLLERRVRERMASK